jgi:triacylglycerol lipase
MLALLFFFSLLLFLASCGDGLALAPPKDASPPAPAVAEQPSGDRVLAATEDPTPAAAAAPDPVGLGPPYPIVLVHGFSGWSSAYSSEYFFNVLDDLADRGITDVFAPALTPYNGSEQRADVLARFIDEVSAFDHKKLSRRLVTHVRAVELALEP